METTGGVALASVAVADAYTDAVMPGLVEARARAATAADKVGVVNVELGPTELKPPRALSSLGEAALT